MTNTLTSAHPQDASYREEALAAIWNLIEPAVVAPKSAQLKKPSHFIEGFTLGNDLAYRILKKGIPSKALNPVGEYLGLNKVSMANYLDMDRGTAARLASTDKRLPTHAAENVLRLLELDAQATDTFANEDEAFAWLNRAHPMLEGDTPLIAAKTSYGAQRVKDILLAIKYGGVV